jgi:hypothetical protein
VFEDVHGNVESGIDQGGLFKEFLTLITQQLFDPNYAYFQETEIDKTLYPNKLA